MIKGIAVVLLSIVAVLLWITYDLIDTKAERIHAKTRQYRQHVSRIEKVIALNLWLSDLQKSAKQTIEKNDERADAQLLSYFDSFQQYGTVTMKEYIKTDKSDPDLKYIEFTFSIPRNNTLAMERILSRNIANGYTQPLHVKTDTNYLKGQFKVYSPFIKDDNVTK